MEYFIKEVLKNWVINKRTEIILNVRVIINAFIKKQGFLKRDLIQSCLVVGPIEKGYLYS